MTRRKLEFSYTVDHRHGLPYVELDVSDGENVTTVFSESINRFINDKDEAGWRLVTEAIRNALENAFDLS